MNSYQILESYQNYGTLSNLWSLYSPPLQTWPLNVKLRSLSQSQPVWKVAVNRNLDFQSFAIRQNFHKKMNENVHNLPDDAYSIFFDVHMRLWCTFCNGVGI